MTPHLPGLRASVLPALPALLAFTILLPAPASAVLRPPALDSPADTLELLPREAKDFRFRRLAGHDLHAAGMALGLLSVPVLLLMPAAAQALDLESPVGGLEDAYFVLTFAALPAFTALMASGNRVYAGAARYHDEREFALTRSPLPLFAFALCAGKAFWLLSDPRLADRDGTEKGILIALSLTELLTLPALRGQFRAASSFLDQVHIRVTGQGPALGLRLDF
jgi:hypothetical protein